MMTSSFLDKMTRRFQRMPFHWRALFAGQALVMAITLGYRAHVVYMHSGSRLKREDELRDKARGITKAADKRAVS